MNDRSAAAARLPSEDAVEAAILAVAGRPDALRTITPEEVARSLAQGPDWQSLLPLVRRCAIRLAEAERLVIYRKGKPVDPADFRGVYRLGLPPQG
ncbi:DUF3253 domain-containing protein [Starkeya sp. 3C]|uniref:DUF3253 domain-containing protein n=1 Tax=Ancylobacter moscoviensis TaxID=2597768 RepID=A0ABY3DTL1_9HYPH|nr:DUF3253 domain-containing protein [Ancylobacter moscoviensis]TSJ63287.1 DUF3253 domain-containing protein [Ancylobacter moscoviensis]